MTTSSMADRYVWTAPDGTVIDLTDEAAGYSVQAEGTRGTYSVEWEFATSQYAGIDGVDVDAIRAKENTPTLGLLMRADDEETYTARRRALVHAMRPRVAGRLTSGVLTVSRPDGTTRSLGCYCIDGLAGDQSADTELPGRWWKTALKLMGPDPWWYGDTATVSAGLGPPTPFFPFFPLVLSPSSVQGEFTIDLTGTDAPTPPVWTVTGPGTSLVLTNETTGQVIDVAATIGSGEIMVIDTRPGHQSVRRGDGTNLMTAVASDPALWTLIEGVNLVTADLSGATSESKITAAYRPLYAGI